MKANVPKGVGGGGGNMNSMIRQAQKMQKQMEEKQEELNVQEFTASVGGGVVELVMLGDKSLKSVKIDPEILDSDDVEMLEDLIVAGVNEVYKKVEEKTEEDMEAITGGLSVPGMF